MSHILSKRKLSFIWHQLKFIVSNILQGAFTCRILIDWFKCNMILRKNYLLSWTNHVVIQLLKEIIWIFSFNNHIRHFNIFDFTKKLDPSFGMLTIKHFIILVKISINLRVRHHINELNKVDFVYFPFHFWKV